MHFCVSEIGYGGGRASPGVDEEELIHLLCNAFGRGLNFIDTAPSYGSGRSETIVGKVIKERSDKYITATKTEALNATGITPMQKAV